MVNCTPVFLITSRDASFLYQLITFLGDTSPIQQPRDVEETIPGHRIFESCLRGLVQVGNCTYLKLPSLGNDAISRLGFLPENHPENCLGKRIC